jgi:TRAP-type C4-dicarboxylate transport system permease small subunit
MAAAMYIVAIVVILVGIILLGFGIYEYQKELKGISTGGKSTSTAWLGLALMFGGIIMIFVAIILFVSGYYSAKLKKTTGVTTKGAKEKSAVQKTTIVKEE